VGKFQIEAGHHRKIEREGAVCINNIDYECHFLYIIHFQINI